VSNKNKNKIKTFETQKSKSKEKTVQKSKASKQAKLPEPAIRPSFKTSSKTAENDEECSGNFALDHLKQ
jgi:ribosomal protein L13E